MRSLLFVPGDSARKLEKSLESGSDALIIDLEDSVSPANKVAARGVASGFLKERRHDIRAKIFIRVNDFTTGLTDDDLAALVPIRPDAIMLPKSTGGADVQRLSVKLRVYEAENGLPDGSIRILPLITETGAAVLAAGTYRGCSPRLLGMSWGGEDLSADIGASATRDAQGRYTDVFRLARSLALLAAASAEVGAVDTVFPNFRDLDAFWADCLESVRDGFVARAAIHPTQVPIINEVFTPSASALEHARALVSAFAADDNPGVVSLNGQMYDRPHLMRAQRLLARAKASGA